MTGDIARAEAAVGNSGDFSITEAHSFLMKGIHVFSDAVHGCKPRPVFGEDSIFARNFWGGDNSPEPEFPDLFEFADSVQLSAGFPETERGRFAAKMEDAGGKGSDEALWDVLTEMDEAFHKRGYGETFIPLTLADDAFTRELVLRFHIWRDPAIQRGSVHPPLRGVAAASYGGSYPNGTAQPATRNEARIAMKRVLSSVNNNLPIDVYAAESGYAF